jgi:hypothetical protein
MPIDDAIPSERTRTYSHDFLGANLAQMGEGNQFVDGTRIIPLIACVTPFLGASISPASQQAVSGGFD